MNETTIGDLYDRSFGLLALGNPAAVPSNAGELTVGELRALLDGTEASLRAVDWSGVLAIIDSPFNPSPLDAETRALLERLAGGDFSQALQGVAELRAQLAPFPDSRLVGEVLNLPVGTAEPVEELDVPEALRWLAGAEGQAFLSSPIYEIDFDAGNWVLQTLGGLEPATDGASGATLSALFGSLAANLHSDAIALLSGQVAAFADAYAANAGARAAIEGYHAAMFDALTSLFRDGGSPADASAIAEAFAASQAPLAGAVLLGSLRVTEISSFDFTVTVPTDGALAGTALRDALYGSNAADIITLGAGADLGFGGLGNDWFIEQAGDGFADIYSGDTGFDTLSYTLGRGGVTVDLAPDGTVTVSVNGVVDTATDIERLDLADGSYLYGLGTDAEFVYLLYAAAFLRTPDLDGFLFWEGADDRGLSPLGVARAFIDSTEFLADFGGSAPAAETYIDLLYANVLGRTADEDGKTFWLGRFEGGSDRAELLQSFAASLEFREQQAGDIDDGFWVV